MPSIAPILAEVSDKVPTIGGIWAVTAMISMVCLIAVVWRRLAALAVLPLAGLWAVIVTLELRDPHVGPAIARELGKDYVTQANVAAVTPLVFTVVGFSRRSR